MKKLICFCWAISLSFSLLAQNNVVGYVYEDSNQNGKKERREKGIPEVAVSNGKEVVLTDNKGKYTLPIGSDNIIFVIKPSGFKVPVGENQLPDFYYIHKPEGSPELKYKGTEPTGKLPKSVNFGLHKIEEPKNFTAMIFGDPQPYNTTELDQFAKGVVDKAKHESNISFGISLGDLAGDDLDLHPPYVEILKRTSWHWYNVMGNHDMNYDAIIDEHSDESFERVFGPSTYSFNHGNAHFIILDDILYPDPRDGKGYWGGFTKTQLDFIENDMKHVSKDKLIVLAFHIPFLHINENGFRNNDRQRLFDILEDYPNRLALSAHTHLQRHNFYTEEDGWKGSSPFHEYNAGTTSGDWYSGKINDDGVPISTMRDGTPKGYALLHIENNQYKIDYQVIGQSREHQIKIFNPKVVANNRGTGSGIFANFYMGDKNDLVEYRIDNGPWKKMSWVEAPDPSYAASVMEWDLMDQLEPGRRPSNPVNATHLWRGSIDTKLAVGKHTITVRAKDMFGRTFTETSEYNVAEPVAY
ncbi:calcineurin-like phosphoesterase family protein [Cyclobacterium sp. 1_MG-2023]|uniref:calcineurin-like phosphoesterase family protein n=1 Tax=Cyclobacterium sp. 1_MG-2023 TaxID=3062681 RepID=UPI0026E1CD9A|nr:calcineurin-like phosphoesterase family protein [Cyclobacterium sp. 1_MG-2023]MDO6437779.1 calcineurin-like phosphoesterase family protein [Cyclobacterium sp. 1_MG-2023]